MVYILILALALRLVFINQSLWLDEAIEALALRGHFGPLLSYSLSDFQPPLYHLILKAWTSLTGFSEISLRIPSLLSGLFTVYFVIKIGELIGNRKIGVIAGLLAATNPLLIYYSQEGRTYMMTTFFATASFYYLIKLLSDQNSPKRYTIYYLLFTTLFLWTSYLSWFVLLTQIIYVIWKKRYDLFLIQTLATATFVLWLPSFYNSLQIGLGDATSIPGWGKVVGGTSLKALALTWVKLNIGRVSFDNKLFYGLVVSVMGLLHAYIFSRINIKKNLILLLWILMPIVLVSLVSLFVPVYSYTRVLFIVPAYLLLLSTGLTKSKSSRLVIIILTTYLLSSTYYYLTPRFHREDWRLLTKDLNIQSGTVVMPSLKQDAPFLYYGLTLPLQTSAEPVNTPQVFYVKYVEDVYDPAGLGPANLGQLGYTITSQRVYPGLEVEIYENSN
jgi:uncharacterized membrane protein